MPAHFKSFADWLGIDRAIAFVLLGRIWSIGGGLVTLALITSRLSPAEQGTYYTFANILGLQIFLELGLGFVLMQVASHEVAHLTIGPRGVLTGDAVAKARLASLLHGAMRLYSLIAGAFLLIILPAGLIFFIQNAPAEVNWLGPWITITFVTAGAIVINPMMAFLEGCGRVAETEARKFRYIVAGNLLCWILLISGARLYCAAGFYAASAIGGALWFWKQHRHWLIDLWHATNPSHSIDWKTEIWPFQWRIAGSWLSGYFIFQLFNPLLYIYAGAAEAGKMGLTLQIANLFGGMAFAWVNTKVPLFGQQISRRDWNALDQSFNAVLIKSSLCLVVILMVAGAGLASIPHLRAILPFDFLINPIDRLVTFRSRMIPGTGITALFACILSQHLIGAFATYLRAHKKEPMLKFSLIIGLIVATSAFISSRYGNATYVALSWCAIQWAIALPWSLIIFTSLRKNWHD